MTVGISDFRLKNFNFILSRVDNSEGLLIRGMAQPNLSFCSKILRKRVLDTEKPEEGYIKGLAQGYEGGN